MARVGQSLQQPFVSCVSYSQDFTATARSRAGFKGDLGLLVRASTLIKHRPPGFLNGGSRGRTEKVKTEEWCLHQLISSQFDFTPLDVPMMPV